MEIHFFSVNKCHYQSTLTEQKKNKLLSQQTYKYRFTVCIDSFQTTEATLFVTLYNVHHENLVFSEMKWA